jgi:precorrin-3B C17-methyltransferase
MSGWVSIVGLGPGRETLVTPEVRGVIAQATDVIGYIPYVKRIEPREGLTLHATDNRVEIDRATHALTLAQKGARVVVVSSGDPGVSAAAAGAPLGHDFCAINLSDNLKPWSVIEHRLRMASRADFAMAFYNPRSKSRPHQFGEALEILRSECGPDRLITFARNVSHVDQTLNTVTLGEATEDMADMRTVVLVGNSATRRVGPYVYTPRSAL